jgi:hypothetical protein
MNPESKIQNFILVKRPKMDINLKISFLSEVDNLLTLRKKEFENKY